MEPLTVILNRFMRLLPFLTAPNSYNQFHYDLFYPYPDVWNGLEDDAPIFFAPSRVQTGSAPARVASPGVGRRRISDHPVGHHVRPYLGWMDMNSSGPHRGEPFW